jgi:hypothetical protein
MRNIKVEVKVKVVEEPKPKPHRGFASAKEYDNWLWAGQPDRVSYCPARPGPEASQEEYDSWLYGGGGH